VPGAASRVCIRPSWTLWKQDAIAGLGEPRAASAAEAREDRRRVKDLERQLHRTDKALAETAALLVLSKKLSAVSTTVRTHDPLEDRQTLIGQIAQARVQAHGSPQPVL
jgi:hypothetical protein